MSVTSDKVSIVVSAFKLIHFNREYIDAAVKEINREIAEKEEAVGLLQKQMVDLAFIRRRIEDNLKPGYGVYWEDEEGDSDR